jgi:hypothetical protein
VWLVLAKKGTTHPTTLSDDDAIDAEALEMAIAVIEESA